MARVKNPLFLLGVAGLVYQILQYFNIAPADATFRNVVDIISYLLIGSGIYSNHFELADIVNVVKETQSAQTTTINNTTPIIPPSEKEVANNGQPTIL